MIILQPNAELCLILNINKIVIGVVEGVRGGAKLLKIIKNFTRLTLDSLLFATGNETYLFSMSIGKLYQLQKEYILGSILLLPWHLVFKFQ